MGACETPQANQPPTGYFWVTETEKEISPDPDSPLGLEGGVTNTRIIDKDLRGQNMTLLRPKAPVPQTTDMNRDMECTY